MLLTKNNSIILLMSKSSALNHRMTKPLYLVSYWCTPSSSDPIIVYQYAHIFFHTRHRNLCVQDHIPMPSFVLFPLLNVNGPRTPLVSECVLDIITDSKLVVFSRYDTVLTLPPNS